jgi:hypothetical protein
MLCSVGRKYLIRFWKDNLLNLIMVERTVDTPSAIALANINPEVYKVSLKCNL